MSERYDVAIIGSGFAGSILARCLAAIGRRVVLLERGKHPRFALGESSTPLAAIALERLADRYDLPDLRALAAYGRWLREMPQVTRGLKRGFTFLAHQPGRALASDGEGAGRLLVAASPGDEVADSHWLRSEVDAYLVERAADEGVEHRAQVDLREAEEEDGGIRLAGRWRGRALDLHAGFVVDASGTGRFLARTLRIPEVQTRSSFTSALLYAHFEGMVPLQEVAPCLGPPGPYPDEQAAVHHLLAEGWMYGLRFDSGLVSAGIELPLGTAQPGGSLEAATSDPEVAFRGIVERYPTLAAQLGPARAVTPVRFVPRLQYRLAHAVGPRWLLLPGSFAAAGPLFSTGIAWSLVAVERVARMLEKNGPPAAAALARYRDLLAREADWIDRLVAGGLRARHRFEAFAAWSLLYFAAASFTEASQRLLSTEQPWCWRAFLGADDRKLSVAIREAEHRLEVALAASGTESDAAFRGWILRAIAPWDVAGFDLLERHGLHPVDLDTLVARAHLLGLDQRDVRAALPRLRRS